MHSCQRFQVKKEPIHIYHSSLEQLRNGNILLRQNIYPVRHLLRLLRWLKRKRNIFFRPVFHKEMMRVKKTQKKKRYLSRWRKDNAYLERIIITRPCMIFLCFIANPNFLVSCLKLLLNLIFFNLKFLYLKEYFIIFPLPIRGKYISCFIKTCNDHNLILIKMYQFLTMSKSFAWKKRFDSF